MMNSANTVSSSGSSSNGTNSTLQQQQQLSQNMQHMSSNPQQGSNPAPGSTGSGLPDSGSASTTTENLDFSYCDPLHTHANMSLFQAIGGGSQNQNHSTVNQMQATPQTWVIDQSTQQQPQMHQQQQQPQSQSQQIQYHPFVLQQQQAHQILSVTNAPTGPTSVNAPSTIAGAPSLSLSQQQQQQQHPQVPQIIMNSMQHQQQQTKTHSHLITATNPASAGVIASQAGVSTIVTGPSGQQMFLGPTATAALLQQHQPQPSPAVPSPSPVAVTPQQYYTIALPQGISAAPPTQSFVPQQIVNTSVQIDQQQLDNPIGRTATTSQATSLATTSNRTNKRKSPAMVLDEKSTKAKVDHQQNLEGEEMSTANQSTTSSAAPAMCTISQNNNNDVNSTKDGVKIDHISSFDGPPPPQLDHSKAFENMSPEERRRHERNLREQQRSYKISQQIKELRNVLAESKIPFKPNKFSILLSVVEYIKQLQARAVFLDNEHRKLINTIRQTTEMVNSGVAPESIGGPDVVSESTTASKTDSEGVSTVGNDAEMLLVQGLDYKSIFSQCSAALGVAALDGRFLACNTEFEIVSGYTKDELERHSLFNLLASEDVEEVFKVMGEMLKSSVDSNSGNGATEGDEAGGGKRKETPPKACWSGVVSQKCQTEDVSY